MAHLSESVIDIKSVKLMDSQVCTLPEIYESKKQDLLNKLNEDERLY